jgi:hypothetical protein
MEAMKQPHDDPAERRAHPRLPRRVPVEILNMGDDPSVPFYQDVVHGETVDASTGGLRIRVPYDVREGADVGIIVRDEYRFQIFLARVVWKIREVSGTLYGLQAPKVDPNRLP